MFGGHALELFKAQPESRRRGGAFGHGPEVLSEPVIVRHEGKAVAMAGLLGGQARSQSLSSDTVVKRRLFSAAFRRAAHLKDRLGRSFGLAIC